MNSPPPQLVMCAATWSMIAYPSAKREWSITRKLQAIKAAGFDGVCSYITPEISLQARQLGLRMMSGFDAKSVADALPRLRAQREAGAHFINVQLLNHDTAPAVAARTAVQLIRAARKLGVGVHLETHRDTATETPEKFDEIVRLYRRATGETLPVTWDHSHFAVSKHLQPPDYSARLLVWPKVIQASQMFHLRPFNGQHCQVPVTNGRGTLTVEFRDYLAFAEDLFVCWLEGPQPGGELWVCPELGMSHGYHLSTQPHAWPEAVRARQELLGSWRRALRRVG
ncbi:xylose isomerase [Horticoccus sp. 23ND18S-11]|uniref:xylose isomerase n=1 Tax=Horticoccus sp. 23ND18S-11 TaxID=3391832 RepID=UPI0039C9CB7E